MTVFNYAIRTPEKTTLTGTCEAGRFEDALSRLEEEGMEVLSLVAVEAGPDREDGGRSRFRNLEVLRRFSDLLAVQKGHRELAEAVEWLRTAVASGATLVESLETHKANLPAQIAGISELAKEDEVARRILLRLVNQLEMADTLRKRAFLSIYSALMNLILLLCLVFLLAFSVFPYLAAIFPRMHLHESPWAAPAVWFQGVYEHLSTSWIPEAFQAYPVTYFFVLLGIVAATAILLRIPFVERIVAGLLRYVPGFQASLGRIQLARYFLTAAAFLRSGAAFDLALPAIRETAKETAEDEDLERRLTNEDEYEDSLRESGLLSPADMNRLDTGRAAHRLETVMSLLSGHAALRAETGFNAVVFSLFEAGALVVLLVSLLVAVFGVVLPLFSLIPAIVPRDTALEIR